MNKAMIIRLLGFFFVLNVFLNDRFVLFYESDDS